MSRENLEGKNQDFSQENREEEIILIEKELIEDLGKDPEKWIEKYAKSFRKIIEGTPFLIDLFHKDKEKAKRKVKELLKKGT